MAKRANEIDFIEFPAVDAARVASAKAFYSEVFGWTFKDWGDDYVDTSSSGVGAGFNADPDHRPAKPLVVICAPNLHATRARIIAAGGRVTKEIFSFPGGRRFHFTDPTGNELAAWSNE